MLELYARPYSRLVLSWEISADWQQDPNLKTDQLAIFSVNTRHATSGAAFTRTALRRL